MGLGVGTTHGARAAARKDYDLDRRKINEIWRAKRARNWSAQQIRNGDFRDEGPRDASLEDSAEVRNFRGDDSVERLRVLLATRDFHGWLLVTS